MNLKKLPDDEKLKLCRIYFFAGFAMLPFLWLINGFWFFEQAFLRKPAYTQQPNIRKFVIGSLIGCAIWTIIFIAWIVTFQLNRVSWGPTGDYMSFVYPRGRE